MKGLYHVLNLEKMKKEADRLDKKSDIFMKLFLGTLFGDFVIWILLGGKQYDPGSELGYLLMAIFALLPFVFWYISHRAGKQMLELRKRIYAIEIQGITAKDEEGADRNRGNMHQAYREVCAENHKPDSIFPVTVCYFSLETLPILLNDGSKIWQHQGKKGCWVDDGDNPTLCLINSTDDMEKFLLNKPDDYATVEAAKSSVLFARIPFSDISHYSVIGSVNNHQTVTGGDVSGFHSVSVNGIGFGSIERDPVKVQNHVTDDRMVELVYLDGTESKTILFSYDSLPILRKLLPQFDRP